jgi:hypothetical protein
MGRECSINWSGKKFIQVLEGMPEANGALTVYKRRCEHYIQMNFRENYYGEMHWIRVS